MKTFKNKAWLVFASAFFLLLAGAGQGTAQVCEPTVWDLTAGQHYPVGTVAVSNDETNIYITYSIDTSAYPDAVFGTLHAWVGFNLADVPANSQGTPVPGQFPYQSGKDPYPSSEGLQSYTFTIPFSDINVTIDPVTCPELPKLYVVTHAEVDMDGTGGEHETAFGGDKPGSGPRWWFYGEYTICCTTGPPPPFCFSETAYAKGTHVWTTDKKSNPDKLPTLGLTKNQWGWAINLTVPGTSYYRIWAGAGLNNTGKGVLVGTLTVEWDGSVATVTYELFDGYYLEEVHIYASDSKPTTTAPGQYGYPEGGYDVGGVATFSTEVPLADTDGTGGVWLIAHAVVSNGGCE